MHLLSEIVKEASGRTAMFTGVPSTFGAFGFGSGWDTFEMVSPVLDVAATEPMTRALKWLETELDDEHPGARLLVVHARGSHPPWDIPRDEVQTLKPEEYSGILDARRGGIMLAALRARRQRSGAPLTRGRLGPAARSRTRRSPGKTPSSINSSRC